MNNTSITIKGESNKVAFLILQSLTNFSILILLSALVYSVRQGDYRISAEVIVLSVLALLFFRRKFLANHGFEDVSIENGNIKHRIFRWIFSKTSTIKKEEIEKAQVINIRKSTIKDTPEYFSDYRVELHLTGGRKYYIGNFIEKRVAEDLLKKIN